MNWESVITNGLICFAVSFLLIYMNKGANSKTHEKTPGVFELRMHKLYMYIGYMGIIVGVLFTIGAMSSNEKGIFPIAMLVLFIMCGSGVLCLLYYKKHKITYSDNSITSGNMIHKNVNILWSEIEEIKFKPISGYYKFTGNNKTIKVNMSIVGLNALLKKAEEKTKLKIKKL